MATKNEAREAEAKIIADWGDKTNMDVRISGNADDGYGYGVVVRFAGDVVPEGFPKTVVLNTATTDTDTVADVYEDDDGNLYIRYSGEVWIDVTGKLFCMFASAQLHKLARTRETIVYVPVTVRTTVSKKG